jgi:F-box protein 11
MSSSHQFCDHCGAANRFQARFCISCGSSMQSISPSIPVSKISPTQPAPHVGIKTQMLPNYTATTNINTATSTLSSIPLHASNTSNSFTGRLHPQALLGQRYRILKLIGRGGMGVVYLAEDLRFGGAPRAVKELCQYGLSPQEAQEAELAFKHEADLLARLVHPNLPRIYDHFDEQGRWYLVMDYIAGETLEQRLEKLPRRIMAPLDTLNIAIQLCSTLHYLHSQQPPIIFRDLKPANIMLTTDDHTYLIDFGIARLFKPGQATDTTALGSFGYAAPEQYGKKTQTTTSADVYSLGVTLHQLLSGYDPSSNPFQFPALKLSSLPCGSELAALILQMVERERDKRPANMLEIKQRLQASLHLLQGQPTVGTGLASAAPVRQLASNKAIKSVIVDQTGAGHYRTLSEAIEELRRSSDVTLDSDQSATLDMDKRKAQPLLLVRPGIYHEQITLDLPIEIRGMGAEEDIILENKDDSCLIVQAENVSIYGLTLRCYVEENTNDFYTVNILQGQPLLEQCRVTGEARACIAIHGNTTNPTLRRCKIYEGHKHGILVSKAAHVTIEDCEIYANTSTQISIREYADASIRHCKIYAGQDCGITAHKNGQGTIEDCEIFANARHGVTLMSEGNLLLKRCIIRANKDGGVASLEHGKGTIEQCEIFNNTRLGIGVTLWGKLDADSCKIHDNGSAGIHIYQHGQGVFKNCDIYHNVTLGIAVKQDGNPHVVHCTIHHNRDAGIAIVDHGGGTFEDCQIYANAKLGVGISSQGDPILRRCKVQHNEDAGIHIYQEGLGTLEDCDISNNQKLGIVISGKGYPMIRGCEIHHNNDGGVHVHQEGRGTFVSCDIHTNRLSCFAISTGGSPDVQSCKLHASPQNGVYVYNNGHGTFERCEIFENILSGVETKTGASPTIRECQIHNNRQYGVHARDNGQGIVERCHIYGNVRGSWNIAAGGHVARL